MPTEKELLEARAAKAAIEAFMDTWDERLQRLWQQHPELTSMLPSLFQGRKISSLDRVNATVPFEPEAVLWHADFAGDPRVSSLLFQITPDGSVKLANYTPFFSRDLEEQ